MSHQTDIDTALVHADMDPEYTKPYTHVVAARILAAEVRRLRPEAAQMHRMAALAAAGEWLADAARNLIAGWAIERYSPQGATVAYDDDEEALAIALHGFMASAGVASVEPESTP